MEKIYDISPVISESSPVFPGDTPFSRQVLLDWPKDHLALSSITTTVHIGAHTDSPLHYHPHGKPIDQVGLEDYLGEALVVDARDFPNQRIPASVLDQDPPKRVLFKTHSFDHDQPFDSNFTSLSPALIDALHKKSVRLVGIDTPSIDPADSKKLESHKKIYEHDMRILEGIRLDHVPAGRYELIALPLAIKGADASPVRAILRTLSTPPRKEEGK